MSFDFDISRHCNASMQSQSLWNRAMSFDNMSQTIERGYRKSQSLWNRAMSFDKKWLSNTIQIKSLNPFGTGQCLSTFTGLQSI
ncbi:Uncharacterised protein [Haemophilus haemolyticus]|uniref:Uncharacterized protein n=1 Tax=Haemophilus haemolyticus TaxID=726 RepID=A0A2X4RKV3_HAEHA|nr:Uncharacterised protein [Haemophilus haemolyticus]